MATSVILALLLFYFCFYQVSSNLRIDEEKNHNNEAFHVFSRGTDRNLMQDKFFKPATSITKYFENGAEAPAPTPSRSVDCGGLCKYRCSQHSRQNLCMRACGTCCVRCKCVPPGTSGNREVCGKCYTDMTTHRSKIKCP